MKIFYLVIILFNIHRISFPQWSQTNGPFTGDVTPLFSIFKNKIYTGTNSGLFFSIDTCRTWNKVHIPTSCQKVTNLFTNDTSIIVGFNNKDFFYTNNTDITWNKINFKFPNNFSVKNIYNSNFILYAYSKDYKMMISKNFGKSWYNFLKTDKNKFEANKYSKNYTKGIYCFFDFEFYASSDNGKTWYLPEPEHFHSTEDLNHKCLVSYEFTCIAENDSIVLLEAGRFYIWNKYSLKLELVGKESDENFFNNKMTLLNGKFFVADTYGLYLYNHKSKTKIPLNIDKTPFIQDANNRQFQVYSLTSNNNKLLIYTDKGLFISSDYGKSWDKINNSFGNNFYYKFNLKFLGNNILILEKDSIYISPNNGINWQKVNYTGNNSNINSIFSNGQLLFAGGDNNYLFVSKDKGNSWDKIDTKMVRNNYSLNKITKIYQNNKGLFADFDGLYYSTDLGLTWKLISDNTINFVTDSLIYTCELIYEHHSVKNRILYSSDNLGKKWNIVIKDSLFGITDFIDNKGVLVIGTSDGLYIFPKDKKLKKIFDEEVQTLAANDSLIVAGTKAGIYISNDNGLTWNIFNNGLPPLKYITYSCGKNKYCPAYEIYSIVFYRNTIIADTYNGVFISKNKGKNWIEFNKGIECFIKDNSRISFRYEPKNTLTKDEEYIYLGTQGNGLWKRPLKDLE